MNPTYTVNHLIDLAIEHAKYVLLSIAALFVLNLLSLFCLLVYFPQSDKAIVTAFLLIPVWPALLAVYGILRLRSDRGATNEEAIKRRKEVTLRYFAIFTFLLVAILFAAWRYTADVEFSQRLAVVVVIPLIILAALLVIIAWYWSKYSNNKLGVLLDKAPIHYLVGATALVIATICYLAYTDLNRFEGRFLPLVQAKLAFGLVAFVSIFFAFGSIVLGYLRPSERVREKILDGAEKLIDKTGGLDQHTEILPYVTRETLDRLVSRVEITSSRLEGLLNQSSNGAFVSNGTAVLAQRVELIRGRLTGELKDLAKRGNLNLMIGILTTLGAISALFWGLIATQPNPQETQAAGLVRHYLPRISFAVFIEVFSFFFLRLYKNSLEDIKYYHNELTNLDSKLLALEMAISASQSEAITPILLGLLNTDRNFILKSGESTVELEKVKTEQQYLRSLIEAVSKKIPDFGTTKTD